MTLRARIGWSPDLKSDELAVMLAGAAAQSGCADEVFDLLAKSRANDDDAESARMPEERFLLEMVDGLALAHDRAVDHLGVALPTLIAHSLTGYATSKRGLADAIGRAHWHIVATEPIAKALPGASLTEAQIDEIALLVQAHFRPEGMAFREPEWNIPQEYWERWQALDIVPMGMPVPQFHDAYVAGRLYQVIAEGDGYADMLRLATMTPLTRVGQLGADWAAEHAARYMTNFGKKQAATATAEVESVNQSVARALIGKYMDGSLKVARAAPGGAKDLTPAERTALETTHAVKDWKTLSRELYKTFKGTESKRDWLRVAASETRLAYNVGRIDAMAESGVKRMYWLVQPGACVHCRRVYLDAKGEPIIFTIAEIQKNIAIRGGLNKGLKAHEWVATGLLHPWCRCRPVPYIESKYTGKIAPTRLT